MYLKRLNMVFCVAAMKTMLLIAVGFLRYRESIGGLSLDLLNYMLISLLSNFLKNRNKKIFQG